MMLTSMTVTKTYAAETRIEPRFTLKSPTEDIAIELLIDGDAFISTYGSDMRTKQNLLSQVQCVVDAISTTGTTPTVKGGVSNNNKPTEVTKLYLVTPENDFTPTEMLSVLAEAGNTIESINSFLCDRLSYAHNVVSDTLSLSDDVANAKGCLTNGEAICMGYANAFSMLAEEAGIKNVKIRGMVGDMYHVMNVVEVEDQLLVVDCTFNDSTYSIKYLLITIDEYCRQVNFVPAVSPDSMMKLKYGE